MIKKITTIKSIGKFKSYEASDISLKNLTGIYSENGRGKTTISSILRSLAKNNPRIILGRRRLNETGKPHFKMELDSGFVEFKNDTWDRHHADFEIFDSHFINENLYSGMQVDINQKRNLYKFIIGDEAIKLNNEVVSLNDRISGLTAEIRDKRNQLIKLIGNEFEVADFVKLDAIEDIDVKIAAKEKEVAALQKSESLAKKDLLESIVIPSYDWEALGALLSKTIEDVSKQAEEKVKSHIGSCLSKTGEEWLKTGLEHLGNSNQCPFCSADVSSNDLVASYKSYFNEQYSLLKNRLVTEATSFKSKFSAALVANLTSKIKINQNCGASWSEYVEIPSIDIPSEGADFFGQLTPMFTTVSDLIEKKRLAPLDSSDADRVSYQELKEKIRKTLSVVAEYNTQVVRINAVLEQFKKGLTSSDLKTELSSLGKLRAAKNRYVENIRTVCEEYLSLENQKVVLEKEKDGAREKLDEVTKKIPEKYQEKINEYLERFGADFRIYDHRKVNPRGEPATEYKILINGAEVPIGDVNSPEEVASFKNTLSEGDKNTLAFSYFLAKLDADANISQKILVFDDPISSLDNSRREWTKSYLKYFGGKAKQLIILSHDSKFLEEMHIEVKKAQREMCCLKIAVNDGGSSLEKIDFTDLNKSPRLRNIEMIQSYVLRGVGSPAEVIKAIRPSCEDYIKDCCPNSISANDNLGSMIRKIREAPTTGDLSILKPILVELDNLNAYTTKEHHGQSGNTGPIDENQLKAQCSLTLKIIKETSGN